MAKHRTLASKMGPARTHYSGGHFRDAAKAIAKAAGWTYVHRAFVHAEALSGDLYAAHVMLYELTGNREGPGLTLVNARESTDKILGDLTRHVFHRLEREDPEAFRRLRSYS